jgi:hypothetical protein
MAQPIIDTDRMSGPRFLSLDRRIPEPVRRLLDEADGCASMWFAVGGSSCVRLAIRKTCELEDLSELDDFHASIAQLGETSVDRADPLSRSSLALAPATNRCKATR